MDHYRRQWSKRLRRIRRWWKDDGYNEVWSQAKELWSRVRVLARSQAKILAFVLCWLSTCVLVFLLSGTTSTEQFKQLACTSVHWTNANQCGLDGRNCRPFEGPELYFRCPSGCKAARLTDPVTIGDWIVNHRPLVVGGKHNGSTALYRGDSFICGAAIHAGIIKNSYGGCGVLRREGESRMFPSSEQNDIDSIPFNSSFPLSWSLKEVTCSYEDPRWKLLTISMIASLLLPSFATSGSTIFSIISAALFFHVALISNPPDEPSISNFKDILSTASGKTVPGASVATIVYRLWIAESFPWKHNDWDKWIPWVLGLWSGALCNLFEPYLQDMQQLGVSLSIGSVTVFTAVFVANQVTSLHQRGLLVRHIALSVVAALGLVILRLTLNGYGLNLHIHHYFWPLPLIPMISTRDKRASFYRALLLGISINGMARWGFADWVEVQAAGSSGPVVLPEIVNPVINGSRILFQWNALAKRCIGVNGLVDDVLRFQGFKAAESLTFEWVRVRDNEDHYFRFGCIFEDEFRGLSMGEYTSVAVWKRDGTWIKA